jgi:hypothetical protein
LKKECFEEKDFEKHSEEETFKTAIEFDTKGFFAPSCSNTTTPLPPRNCKKLLLRKSTLKKIL